MHQGKLIRLILIIYKNHTQLIYLDQNARTYLKLRDPLCMFASEISSLSLTTTLRSLGLAGNYSPCSRAWTRLDARVHVQLKVGWGFELIRSSVINDRTKKSLLSKRNSRRGLQRDTEAGWKGGAASKSSCKQHLCAPLLASIHFSFHLHQGDCRLKGSADTGALMANGGKT